MRSADVDPPAKNKIQTIKRNIHAILLKFRQTLVEKLNPSNI
jgi:hypothetical protein